MSGGMDGSGNARRYAWEKISHNCPCGRTVYGNGKTHQRTCAVHLREHGWPLDNAMATAVRNEYRGQGVDVIRAVEKRLGADYLARREAGDLSELRWIEYRDRVWSYADEAAMGKGGAR